MSRSMRAFLGLSLTGGQRREIRKQLAAITEGRLPVRWVPEENLHLTIRFLGDVEPTALSAIETAVGEAVAVSGEIPYALGRTGAFPAIERPRVLWVGVSEGDEPIRDLARRVDQALRPLGYEEESRFHSHITVGRCKGRLPEEVLLLFRDTPIRALAASAATLNLFKSTLSRRGANYEIIRRIPLSR